MMKNKKDKDEEDAESQEAASSKAKKPKATTATRPAIKSLTPAELTEMDEGLRPDIMWLEGHSSPYGDVKRRWKETQPLRIQGPAGNFMTSIDAFSKTAVMRNSSAPILAELVS